jgi:hypothetical protein
MQKEEPLEPPLFGQNLSNAIRWLASLGGAAATAIWVLSTDAGANQRLVWLMERARPACDHSIANKEELHRFARDQLAANDTKEDALRALVALCQAKLRAEAGAIAL